MGAFSGCEVPCAAGAPVPHTAMGRVSRECGQTSLHLICCSTASRSWMAPGHEVSEGDTVVKGWCPHRGCTHGVPVPHTGGERGVRAKGAAAAAAPQGRAGRRHWGVGVRLGLGVCHDPGCSRGSGSRHGCVLLQDRQPWQRERGCKGFHLFLQCLQLPTVFWVLQLVLEFL